MKKTLILKAEDVRKVLDIKHALSFVERAFKAYARGETQMPAKIYLHLDESNGDFRAMPAYISGMGACGVKWVNVHPDNRRKGLPTVMAVVILADPSTGFPLSIMDGTYITNVRTGAAGGVAAKYLARRDSRVVALVGCGAQAQAQLLTLAELFEISGVKVWGRQKRQAVNFKKRFKQFNVIVSDTVEGCVKDADIVATTTPSRRPLVRLKWLKKGAHINAIGADAPGKEELEPAILKRATKLVIDDWAQASHSGEINVPLSKGIISKKNIYGSLGEIVAGKKKGRISRGELTIFDSTGLAIQDIACAKFVYEEAKRKGLGQWIRLF